MSLTATAHKDRLLLSVHKSSQTLSVGEYDSKGKFISKVCDSLEALGPVHLMLSGHSHVLCCGSKSGAVAVQLLADIRVKHSRSFVSSKQAARHEQRRGSRVDDDSLVHFRRRQEVDFDGQDRWSLPIPLRKHHRHPQFSSTSDIVVAGCALSLSGMDFFFTVNPVGAISVCVLHQGSEVRSYFNPPFLHSQGLVTALAAYRGSLYLGTQSGTLAVISLAPLLAGDINSAGRLKDHVVQQDSLFSAPSAAAVANPIGSDTGNVTGDDKVRGNPGGPKIESADEIDDGVFDERKADDGIGINRDQPVTESGYYRGGDLSHTVTCMATVSPNGFMGLKDEDEVHRSAQTAAAANGLSTDGPLNGGGVEANNGGGAMLEGHLLLVAGYDGKSHSVKGTRLVERVK
jgi:hypothetical protein